MALNSEIQSEADIIFIAVAKRFKEFCFSNSFKSISQEKNNDKS